MPVSTRSGRVSKRPGQPTATAKTPRNNARPQPFPVRKERQRSILAASKSKEKRVQSPTSNAHQGIQEPEQEHGTPHPVKRITSGIWASSLPTISFVQQDGLDTDADTETITLNLVDYFLRPENWDQRLSCNVLATSCFYFASKVTGKEGNTADRIAESFTVEPAFVFQVSVWLYGYADAVGVQRTGRALQVEREDILRGCGVLWERRGAIGQLLGGYEERLERLPGPDGTIVAAGVRSEPQDGVEDDELLLLDDDDYKQASYAMAPEEKASEADLDFEFNVDTDGW